MLDRKALVGLLEQQGLDTASFTDFAGFESGPSYRLTVKDRAALAAWHTLHGLVDQTGYWPVIVNQCPTFEYIATRGGEPGPPQEIITEGLSLDWEQVLHQRVEAYQSAYGRPITEGLPRGEWPEPNATPRASDEPADGGASLPRTSLSQEDVDRIREHALREVGEQFQPEDGPPVSEALEQGEFPERVETAPQLNNLVVERSDDMYFVLLPTVEGWQIPAYLNFGAWNDCPSPREHVGMLKHWQEAYGADLLGMTDTTIVMHVKRPPRDRESALTLAWEHYVYCQETIGYDFVTNTLEDLAARLLNASMWSFWWD